MGQYQGIVNSASTVGKALGPLFGGVLVDMFNMRIMFLTIILLLGISIIILSLFTKSKAAKNIWIINISTLIKN